MLFNFLCPLLDIGDSNKGLLLRTIQYSHDAKPHALRRCIRNQLTLSFCFLQNL